ncbi:MAG: LAGLIDADG family homing endonuclease [Candidatus Freyarchaeota archaeon]
MLKILWLSDRITGHSAYSKVGWQLCTRTVKMGHAVAHSPMGGANKMGRQVYGGVLIYESGENKFGEDVAVDQYVDFGADILIAFKEPWVFQTLHKYAVNFVPYAAVDHSPVSTSLTSRLTTAFKVLTPSRHGQMELRKAGIEDVHYLPHGVDTSIYKPLENKAECRKLWFLKPDDFVLLYVGWNRARKMVPRMLRIYKRFLELNPDVKNAHFLLWTNMVPETAPQETVSGVSDVGVNLIREVMELGLATPPNDVRWFDPKEWAKLRRIGGIPERDPKGGWDMVKLYNNANVLLFTTAGEGFGLPLIEAQACLPLGTIVYCNGGLKPIEKVKVGDVVLGHDGIWHKVTKTFKRYFVGNLIKVEVSRFRLPVSLTPEHPVLLENGRWVKAEKLKEGNRVRFPIPVETYCNLLEPKLKVSDYVPEVVISDQIAFLKGGCQGKGKTTLWPHPNTHHIKNEVPLTPDFLRLCGYFIAEGSARSSHQVRLSFNINEKEYITDVTNIAKNIFKVDATLKEVKKQNTTIVSINSKIISELFFKLFGKGARNKRIPKLFMILPVVLQRELIKGLWRGDGSVSIDAHGYVTYRYTTASRNLATQIVLILLRMGVVPQIEKASSWKGKYGDRDYYRIIVKGEQTKKMDYIYGKSLERRKRKIIRNVGLHKNFVSMRVRKVITVPYKGLVYNLEVEGSNSYTTEAFSVHNCGVPVITTDYAGAPEQVGAGYSIPYNDYVVISTPGTRFALVDIDRAAEALTKIYNGDREKMARRARTFAERYDWNRIMDRYWKPFLENAETELYPKVTKEGLSKWI